MALWYNGHMSFLLLVFSVSIMASCANMYCVERGADYSLETFLELPHHIALKYAPTPLSQVCENRVVSGVAKDANTAVYYIDANQYIQLAFKGLGAYGLSYFRGGLPFWHVELSPLGMCCSHIDLATQSKRHKYFLIQKDDSCMKVQFVPDLVGTYPLRDKRACCDAFLSNGMSGIIFSQELGCEYSLIVKALLFDQGMDLSLSCTFKERGTINFNAGEMIWGLNDLKKRFAALNVVEPRLSYCDGSGRKAKVRVPEAPTTFATVLKKAQALGDVASSETKQESKKTVSLCPVTCLKKSPDVEPTASASKSQCLERGCRASRGISGGRMERHGTSPLSIPRHTLDRQGKFHQYILYTNGLVRAFVPRWHRMVDDVILFLVYKDLNNELRECYFTVKKSGRRAFFSLCSNDGYEGICAQQLLREGQVLAPCMTMKVGFAVKGLLVANIFAVNGDCEDDSNADFRDRLNVVIKEGGCMAMKAHGALKVGAQVHESREPDLIWQLKEVKNFKGGMKKGDQKVLNSTLIPRLLALTPLLGEVVLPNIKRLDLSAKLLFKVVGGVLSLNANVAFMNFPAVNIALYRDPVSTDARMGVDRSGSTLIWQNYRLQVQAASAKRFYSMELTKEGEKIVSGFFLVNDGYWRPSVLVHGHGKSWTKWCAILPALQKPPQPEMVIAWKEGRTVIEWNDTGKISTAQCIWGLSQKYNAQARGVFMVLDFRNPRNAYWRFCYEGVEELVSLRHLANPSQEILEYEIVLDGNRVAIRLVGKSRPLHEVFVAHCSTRFSPAYSVVCESDSAQRPFYFVP